MAKSGWQSIQRLASSSASVPQPDFCSVASISSRGVMAKPGCSAPSRRASAPITSWLERHSPGGSISFGPSRMYWLPPAVIEVVVLDEHGGRQHDVGDFRGVGHELLVHADEQIVAREAALDHLLVGRDRHRIGVLDQQRRDRAAALQRFLVAGQDRADARLVEHADRRVAQVEPSIRVLLRWKTSPLLWKAPPPS